MTSFNDKPRDPSGKGCGVLGMGSLLASENGSDTTAKPTYSQEADLFRPCLSRENATGETSAEAARAAERKAPTLRQRVLDVLRASPTPLTPEQVANIIAAPAATPKDIAVSIPGLRPRFSELMRLGLICDSGKRGDGLGGCRSIAWEAVPDVDAPSPAVVERHMDADGERVKRAYQTARQKLAGRRPVDVLAEMLLEQEHPEGVGVSQ